jgi:hypothetical protein
MKICLHQAFRPERKNLSNPPGVGECFDCEYNPEENKNCKKYVSINIQIVDLFEENDQQGNQCDNYS